MLGAFCFVFKAESGRETAGRRIRFEAEMNLTYRQFYAFVKFRSYDFAFLDQLSSLIVTLDAVSGRDSEELRRFLESKCNKKYRYA